MQVRYRLWDKVLKRMFYTHFEQLDNGFACLIDEHLEDETPVIMPYTGLDDKNGKGIYAGDIVKCSNGMVEQYELKYMLGSFVGYDSKTCFCKKIEEMQQIEVVGNIYEC